MIIQKLLETLQHLPSAQEEEVINLFIFLSQLTADTIIQEIESASKLIFLTFSKLYPTDYYNKYLNILNNLKENSWVDMACLLIHKNPVRVCIKDKFIFQIVLFTSLKYKKSLFIQNTVEGESTVTFLQDVLVRLLQLVCIDKPQFLHILKFIEMILKKREDVLNPELSLFTLKCMNKAASSPLTGFKHSAHNISRTVIRSLSLNTRKYLCNFNNLPIKGIDLNDVLRLVEEEEVRRSLPSINRKILKLFCNNTESRDGSFYYETLISFYSFEDFKNDVWPFYSQHVEEYSEGELYQSFLKYWVPITVSRYKDDFYMFVKNENIDHQLKAYILLELKKKGHYDKFKFDSDALGFLKFSTTAILGLKIISTYSKKNIWPDYVEIKAVQYYCNYFSESELSVEALKCIKQFISQIFFVSHQILSKNLDRNLNLYSEFLIYMYKFCTTRIVEGECELSAQLLKIIWDVAAGSSADLLTRYKIDRENVYEAGGNLYYLKLKKCELWVKTFSGESLLSDIKMFLGRNLQYCPNLANLVKERYLRKINLDFMTFGMLLDAVNQSICLQSSQKTRLYADLILADKKLKGVNCHKDVAQLVDIFNSSLGCKNLFYSVLLLDIFVIVANYYDTDELVPVLERALLFFEKILNANTHSDLNIKTTKVLESFINNVIECLIASKKHWSKFHKQQILNQLCKIIKKSNMKRPVSMSIDLVQHFGRLMEEIDEDREIKIKLLNRTLNSLYCTKQGGKIRRNPETRLVIQALCLSDNNLTKPYLVWSLNFMLEVLANPSSSDYTLSSTLHSLEVLVSDNSIHQFTLPYIPEIIEHCVSLFNKTNWIVRNADLQLLKSLIERFLGVLLDHNVRPKTIEDLFVLFPSTIEYFYKTLSVPTLTDSAVIVLLFFSESQIKTNLFIEETLKNEFEKFRHLFVHIIKNYSNNFGFLAIKAFTALCIDSKIPHVFLEIVNYIQRNFEQMSKNVFANLIKLLQELYYKHRTSLFQTGGDIINRAMGNLVMYLKDYNCFYFNLLSLKLYTIEDAIKTVIPGLGTEINYNRRIWLNNYVPFVIMAVDINQLGSLLNEMLLLHEIPDFLQIKILSILVDRFCKKCHTLYEVIKILILKLAKVEDCNKFLIMCYAKSIFLFYEIVNGLNLSNNLISKVREDFNTTCIYKVFVYVLILAHSENRTNTDEQFLDSSIKKYIDHIEDDEILVDLAPSVVHLYKASPKRNRFYVIKLTLYLLLNNFTSFEMCKFVSFLTKSQCSSVLMSFVLLLKLDNLSNYVGDEKLAIKLLLEFYRFVDKLPDELEESDTYYLIENDFSLPKLYIKKIILKTLSELQ